ncbi:MAG: hypothetical protein ACTS7E_03800 [Arsenophonus sp. NC-CH8-MAG3]
MHPTPDIRRLACKFNVKLSKLNEIGRKGNLLRKDRCSGLFQRGVKHSEAKATRVVVY